MSLGGALWIAFVVVLTLLAIKAAGLLGALVIILAFAVLL